MVGGGRRGGAADEVKLNTGNVFAALESLKKKKKGDKGKAAGSSSSSSRKKHGDGAARQQEPPQKEVFWAPAPLTTKSWADVEDDDDDDYFATTAPPRPVWGTESHGDDAAKDEQDVEDAVRAALQEVYPPLPLYTTIRLLVWLKKCASGCVDTLEMLLLFNLCSLIS
jgi:hypothetical protein